MKFRYGLDRLRRWIGRPRPDDRRLLPPPLPLSIVHEVSGYANLAAGTVVVTPRGVEIPIGSARGWDVVTFTRLLAQIDRLPEVEPVRRWAL